MSKILSNKKEYISYGVAVLLGLTMSALAASASTTISTNIVTAGTLTVTGSGASAFTGNVGIASTTPGYALSVTGSGFFDGGTVTASKLIATSTLSVAGATTLVGATLSGNLVVTTGAGATSTATVGCLELYATSSATKVHTVYNTISTTTTINGDTVNGGIFWSYGSCH